MVGFASFRYNVKKADLPRFITNARTFFGEFEWKITVSDMTIKSRDIQHAIDRLNPSDNDTIVFETGRIWNGLTFMNTFPAPNFAQTQISQEKRDQFTDVANRIARNYHDSGHEVAIFAKLDNFSWESGDISIVMALVNEQMPLHGYIFAPSTKEIWLRKQGSHHLMGIRESRRDENEVEYTNCYRSMVFDIDDGFQEAYGDDSIPIEFQTAFDRWVEGGRVGSIF